MKEILIANPSALTIHPAAALFSMLEGNQLNDFVEDVRVNGLLTPIVVLDGQILDGRNRLKACELAGIPPRFDEYDLDGSIVDWIFSVNLHRRHLTTSQRALLVARQLELRALETRQRIGMESQLPSEEPGRARSRAAKQADVGDGTLRNARAVLDRGVPELVERVATGDVSLDAAARVASLPVETQREIVREGKEAQKSKEIRHARAPGSAPPAIPKPPEMPPLPPITAAVAASEDDPEDCAADEEDEDGPPFVVPRPLDVSTFHLRHPGGTSRAEEAPRVDELAKGASNVFQAFTWLLFDWENRQVWDMEFAQPAVKEISHHLLLVTTKLEMLADVCHGRKRAPTGQGR